ncbi:vWA-like protein [Gigaspora margarita]|uniref:VWA-like protein n=1 Tax=Gigaspora margarita TaxID=4874 RepID=A0A8H4B1X9_GIGMA|nr:vWA-like protein [Gigaspora margarita]
MVLEATMIVLDNSEWMRNGDYTPTRLEAQKDAVNLIFSSKTQQNPENTVGMLTMAGKSPEVLVTLTSDHGKILTALHKTQIGGKINFTTGIQIAQLALKHRQNKNQRQRIIVFVGSPIEDDKNTLIKLAKRTKKNNIAVDVINFGEEAENTTKLDAFVNTVKSGDNSHLVTVPPGPHILSDILISSPIIAGEDGGVPPGFTVGSGGSYEFGVDPNLDPELAMALRISLEEEKQRQEEEKVRQEAEAAKTTTAAVANQEAEPTTMAVDQPITGGDSADRNENSLSQPLTSENDGDVQMEELTEEEQMARAIEMSMQSGDGIVVSDEVMSSVLQSLPGVDTHDPRIQNVLQQGFSGNNNNRKENDGKDGENEKK